MPDRIFISPTTDRLFGKTIEIPLDLIIECPQIPENSIALYREEMHKQILKSMCIPRCIWSDYRCPFSFMNDFDNWFKWQKRVVGYEESSGHATGEMLGWDQDKMKPFEIHRSFNYSSHHRFGPGYENPLQMILRGGTA